MRRTLAARAMTTPMPAALPATPMSSRLHRLPPPPPPLTPGRPGLDRVLDLVTEHETHYRQQARAALRYTALHPALRPALRPGHQAPDVAANAASAAPGAAHGGAFEAAGGLRGAAGPRVRRGRRSGLLPQLVSLFSCAALTGGPSRRRHGELWEELSASRAAAEAAQRQARARRTLTQHRAPRLTRPRRNAGDRL